MRDICVALKFKFKFSVTCGFQLQCEVYGFPLIAKDRQVAG